MTNLSDADVQIIYQNLVKTQLAGTAASVERCALELPSAAAPHLFSAAVQIRTALEICNASTARDGFLAHRQIPLQFNAGCAR